MKKKKEQQNQQKPAKSYATTTTRGCVFSKDYSPFVNHKCLECEFCYANIDPQPKVIDKGSARLKNEKFYNPNLYDVPLTIGRYVEPLLNTNVTNHVYAVVKDILQGGGQIILKTSQKLTHLASFTDLFEEYSDNVLIQYRLLTDATYTGAIVQQAIAPNFYTSNLLFEDARIAKEICGLNVSFIVDPFIIGVNDNDLVGIIRRASDIGVNKVIVKQLFATPYFKMFLSKMIDGKFTNLLTDEYNGYLTYDNMTFLKSLMPALEEIEKQDNFEIGICSNRYINSLVCNSSNCCLFDNPKAIYNIDIPTWNRSKNNQFVIPLRNDDATIQTQ